MKKNILLSFVIPAHNEEKTISLVIQPILDQIKKNFKLFEVIVINDGSTDKTSQIVKDLNSKIKLINFDKGHSAAFSRNRGAEIAKGKYIVFLDADQIIQEGFVKDLVKLISDKDYEVLSYFVYPYKPHTIFQRAWVGFRKVHLCRGFIFRREIFNKLKFNEHLFYIEDNDIWERFRNKGYKLTDTGLKIYHIDTESFDDFIRQRKWHGRGILCGIFVKKKLFFLRYFVPCILLIPIAFFSIWPLVAYFIIMWLFFSIKSKDIINSLLWVIIDYLGRFISLYYFLKELFFKKDFLRQIKQA